MNADRLSPALVTGAGGFIGHHLVDKLISEDVEVRALVRPNSVHTDRLRPESVEIIEVDLVDASAVWRATRGVRSIFHLAGEKSYRSREAIHRSNIQGTENIVTSAISVGIERFIYISDTEIYDLSRVRRGEKIREDAPVQSDPRTMSYYAYGEIINERRLFEAHESDGLPVTVLRPGMVVGPMGQVSFPHLGYRYGDKLFLMVGKGDDFLPLACVENVIDGIYQAAITPRAIGEAYNLVDDLEITVREYLELLAETIGTRARIIAMPYLLPYLAVLAYEAVSAFGLVRKGVTSRSQFRWKHSPMRFDNEKMRKELGWRPRVPLRECLEETFRWYADEIERKVTCCGPDSRL